MTTRSAPAGPETGPIDRLQVRDLAHPGQLAACVVARALLHLLDVAVEQLVEAERLAGGAAGAKGVGASSLVRGSGGDERLDPGVDSLVEPPAVHVEAEDRRRVARLGGPELGASGFGCRFDQREIRQRGAQVEAGPTEDDRRRPAASAASISAWASGM